MNSALRYILTGLVLFSLTGCFNFGGDETDQGTPSEGYTTYKTEQFNIDVPSAWEVISEDEFTSDVPDVTVVVFRNNVKNETFTANVNIVSKQLQEPVSSLEYAKMVVNRQSNGLVDYNEQAKDTVKINRGGEEVDTLFTRFEARKTASDNLVRYVQTYGVTGDTAFIVTGAVSTQESESVLQTVEKIVKSFSLS